MSRHFFTSDDIAFQREINRRVLDNPRRMDTPPSLHRVNGSNVAVNTTVYGINNTSIAIPAGRAVLLVSVAEWVPGGSVPAAYIVTPALSAMLPWGVTMNEIPANGGRDLVITDGVITGNAGNFYPASWQNTAPSVEIPMDGTGRLFVPAFARIGAIAYSGDFAVTPLALNENGTTTLHINAGALSINGVPFTIVAQTITAPANFTRVYLRLPPVGVDGSVEIIADGGGETGGNGALLATFVNNCIRQRQRGPASLLRVVDVIDLGDGEL